MKKVGNRVKRALAAKKATQEEESAQTLQPNQASSAAGLQPAFAPISSEMIQRIQERKGSSLSRQSRQEKAQRRKERVKEGEEGVPEDQMEHLRKCVQKSA